MKITYGLRENSIDVTDICYKKLKTQNDRRGIKNDIYIFRIVQL